MQAHAGDPTQERGADTTEGTEGPLTDYFDGAPKRPDHGGNTVTDTVRIDPQRSVVLSLHLQNDIFHSDGKLNLGEGVPEEISAPMFEATHKLLDGAREAGVPIIFDRVAHRPGYGELTANNGLFKLCMELGALQEGTWGAEFIEDFEPRPEDFVITTSRVSAFHNSKLQDLLRKFGTEHVIISGVATNLVVESTARQASDIGYDVWIASDACASPFPGAHEASLQTLSMLATVLPVDGIVAALKAGKQAEATASVGG